MYFKVCFLRKRSSNHWNLWCNYGRLHKKGLCKTHEGLEQQWELQMCWGYHSIGNQSRSTAWSTTATNQFTDPSRTGFGPTTSLKHESTIVLPWFCPKTEKQVCTYLKKPEESCYIQHHIMVCEGRRRCYFFHNTVKHHAQLFLQDMLQNTLGWYQCCHLGIISWGRVERKIKKIRELISYLLNSFV